MSGRLSLKSFIQTAPLLMSLWALLASSGFAQEVVLDAGVASPPPPPSDVAPAEIVLTAPQLGQAAGPKLKREALKQELQRLVDARKSKIRAAPQKDYRDGTSAMRSIGGSVTGTLSSGHKDPLPSIGAAPHLSFSAASRGSVSAGYVETQGTQAADGDALEAEFKSKAIGLLFGEGYENEDDLDETQKKKLEQQLKQLKPDLVQAKRVLSDSYDAAVGAGVDHSNELYADGSLDIKGLGVRYGNWPSSWSADGRWSDGMRTVAAGTAEISARGAIGFSTLGNGARNCGFLLAGGGHLDAKSSFAHPSDVSGEVFAGADLDLGGICRVADDVTAALVVGPGLQGGIANIPVADDPNATDHTEEYGPLGLNAKTKVVAGKVASVTGETSYQFASNGRQVAYNRLSNNLRVRVNVNGDPNSHRDEGMMIGVDGSYNYYHATDPDAAKAYKVAPDGHEGALTFTVGRAF